MNPDDILIWPDGFWCYREEFREDFLRGDNYRVVAHLSDEWQKIEAPDPFAG